MQTFACNTSDCFTIFEEKCTEEAKCDFDKLNYACDITSIKYCVGIHSTNKFRMFVLFLLREI